MQTVVHHKSGYDFNKIIYNLNKKKKNKLMRRRETKS